MFTRRFHPDRFLRSVYGTQPFVDYCRQRHIAFEQTLSTSPGDADLHRWSAALSQLSHEQHAQVELELATVNEMAGRDAVAHLIEAAGETELPGDTIPGGAPLALLFFVHRRELFHEVFLHHEIRETRSWRTARAAADLPIAELPGKRAALSAALRDFFRLREGTGRFCSVDAQRVGDVYCFVAQVADRLQFVEGFTDAGEPRIERLRPALPVLFAYYPQDGTVLLKSHLRAADRVRELLQCFGAAVLAAPVEPIAGAFDLDRLKSPFHPLPDSDDCEMVRVKALHLQYPDRLGRRQVKLETLSGDEPAAMEQLVRAHLGNGFIAEQLRVCHAELQVRLRVGGQSKTYLVRLWPDRCSLNQTVLGERLRACLKQWGLSHANER